MNINKFEKENVNLVATSANKIAGYMSQNCKIVYSSRNLATYMQRYQTKKEIDLSSDI